MRKVLRDCLQTKTFASTFTCVLRRTLVLMYLLAGTFFISYGQSAGANLDQARNDAFSTPLTPMAWVNGNLNDNQAHYIERH